MSDPSPSRAPSEWRGPAAIVLAALFWSSGGVGIKSLATDVSALAITGWRSLFALALLLFAAGPPGDLVRLFRRPIVLLTAAAYAATLTLFVTATTLTTAANAILLQYTAPFWVILAGLVTGEEKPRGRELLLTLGCFGGLSLFFLDRVSAEGLRGILFALLSGIAMGAMTLGLRRMGREGERGAAVAAVVLGNVVCGLLCAPAMVSALPRIGGGQWLVLAGLGLFQIALPYLFFSYGVRHVPALRATLLAMIEPLLNPVWVALVTGELPGTGTILGGAIILGALVLDALLPRRREEPIIIPVD